ncbi:MAG: ribonuclease III [Clostridia bacterium]|nr:ribonuclease III [Clostridia bacterium]
MRTQAQQLMQRIGYTFRDPALLEEALTHSSYANESNRRLRCNERLEFLGDAVLGFICARALFEQDDGDEGSLTVRRAERVCEKALASYARRIALGSALLLGKGEAAGGGAERASILSDAFEALLAAIYLDGGLTAAEAFVLPFLHTGIPARKERSTDYKTQLQVIVQHNPEEQLSYVLTKEEGPDHDKHFEVEVHLNSNVIGRGSGHSKKEAEQQAAREALRLMGY